MSTPRPSRTIPNTTGSNMPGSQKITVMRVLPYGIAAVSILLWAISRFGYHAGPIVHVMLVIALLAALWLEVIQWKKTH